METQTTETTENSSVLPVITTDATETLDQSTVPVIDHQQTTESETTLDQSPSPITNMPTAETTTPPEVTNTQSTENLEQTISPEVSNTYQSENLEQTTSPEVSNTHQTEPLDQSNLNPVSNTQSTETLDQSTFPSLADTEITEIAEQSVMPSDVTDNSHDQLISSPENHQVTETRHETAEEEAETKIVLKDIAATGKFWYDWEKLRSMLSLHLKQVISEYPQAKMTIEEQRDSLGESYAELVKRLDDDLHSFVDGPPFTIQRLSEIILDARSLYPKLSKLALALEKNLSVTSTLTISSDPNPQSPITTPNGLVNVTDDQNSNSNSNSYLQLQSDTVMENGVAADRDEIMTEVDADVSDVTTMDVETNEKSSDSSPMTTSDS